MVPFYKRDDENVEPGLYLALCRGFPVGKINVEGFDGSCGPLIGPLKFVKTVYGYEIRFEFSKEGGGKVYGMKDAEVLVTQFGSIVLDNIQYGNWIVLNIERKKHEVPDTKISEA